MQNYSTQTLDKNLRNRLESAVKKARVIAEQAASQVLKRLDVGESSPADYLTEEQRSLRTRLRALGRQLGDVKQASASQSLDNLITSVAYEHW